MTITHHRQYCDEKKNEYEKEYPMKTRHKTLYEVCLFKLVKACLLRFVTVC